MIINLKILGSGFAASPIIINYDNVYLHYNIKKSDQIDTDTNQPIEGLYEYDEIIMSKDEYIEFLQSQISANKKENESQTDAIINYLLNDKIDIDFLVNQLHAGTITFNDIPANIYDEVQHAYTNKIYHIEYPAIGLNL